MFEEQHTNTIQLEFQEKYDEIPIKLKLYLQITMGETHFWHIGHQIRRVPTFGVPGRQNRMLRDNSKQ